MMVTSGGVNQWRGDGDVMVAQAVNRVQIDAHPLAVAPFQQQRPLTENTLDSTVDSGHPQ